MKDALTGLEMRLASIEAGHRQALRDSELDASNEKGGGGGLCQSVPSSDASGGGGGAVKPGRESELKLWGPHFACFGSQVHQWLLVL